MLSDHVREPAISLGEPIALARRGDGPAPLSFHQGAHSPYAIRWFGVTSLFGHLRHFAASAIASEQVDSRDWMRPLDADELLARVVQVIAPEESARRPTSVTDALGRPLWIDFIADTGDDRDLSVAIGEMIFAEYTVPGSTGGARRLPRGEILLMGGDTAYPVATAHEIEQRLLAPWNQVLHQIEPDGPRTRRALLAIPGNHDWYDGLDGFARMFRKSATDEAPIDAHATGRSSTASYSGARRRDGKRHRTGGLVAKQLHLDEIGGLLRLLRDASRSVRAFFRGSAVVRRKRLVLEGYEPVQEASYWALKLAPGLEAWGVDRQLRKIDFRQRSFFGARRDEATRDKVLFVAPDPAVAFEERHEPGAQMLTACKLDLTEDRVLYLCGDVHHYERRKVFESLHVIAGGGGAFSHGTRVGPKASRPFGGPTAMTFPNRETSRRLLLQVPLKLMAGKAGFLAHIAAAIVASIELGADAGGTRAFVATGAIVTALLVALLYMVAGHPPRHARKVFALSIPFGAALGLMPVALKLALQGVPRLTGDGVVVLVYAFAGALVFGLFLTVLSLLGLEHQQAFSVLGHPGFKHFVRLCVHPDGKVEGWAIGKDDPLAKGAPVLIDDFVWGDAPR